RVDARKQAQQPLFAFDEMEVDWVVVYGLLNQLDEIAAQGLPDWPAGARVEIAEETVRAWYEGQVLTDPRIAFLVGQALRPFLHRAALAARPHLSPSAYRRWGHCPVCGGEPDFSTLERESGVRLLFCSRCDTGWCYKRIGCPFCDTENPRKLAYYPSDDGIYRLYVCDECNGYMKTMDLREAMRPFVLQVERVLTAGMDLTASEAGYRPSASIGKL
ncbi:MAG: formate dehydrogenase accessory protein FdhE, partial [Anaerolineae bacterium]